MSRLLASNDPETVLFRREGEAFTAGRFLSEAQALAIRLPDRRWAMNLCDDRYQFAIGLAAALIRGQTTLMPPNRAPEMIRDLLTEYADSHIIWDRPLEDFDPCDPGHTGASPVTVTDGLLADAGDFTVPAPDPQQIAVMAFTSGSTGKPKPNPKTWQSLVTGTEMACKRFFGDGGQTPTRQVVATVPAQHMYGLETSVLYALLGNCPTHSGRPFFAADVVAALEALPEPRVLVTTPAHLRALLQSGLRPPPIEFVISATAPLPLSLAEKAEQTFDTEVREIYGCTEAGSLASRRQTQSDLWQLYDGMSLSEAEGEDQERFMLDGPQLAAPVELQDRIEIEADGRFRLLGRNEDMLNIAGKRASLSDLTARLLELDGVTDAVMLTPTDNDDARVGRIAAMVVAPTRDADSLLQELREHIDPAFLPRPLLCVDTLPRSETSKLPRAAVLALFAEHLQRQRSPA